MSTENKVAGTRNLPLAIKAGLVCGLLVALLGLWASPVAAFLGLAGVGCAGYYVTRRLPPPWPPTAWTAGLLVGGVAGLVNAVAQLAYLLSGLPGGRFSTALWLWPTTLGAWFSMAALRLLLLAGIGALGSWIALLNPSGAKR